MDKHALLGLILAGLVEELEALLRAAKAAHAESTHEQSKAENKYDTRALEASYLAHGQSRQAAEIEVAIASFESMDVRDFKESDPIDVGALVELDQAGDRSYYFIAFKAGGMELELNIRGKTDKPGQLQERQTVLVITPQSPLGQQLQGRKSGDLVQISLGGARTEYRVRGVW